jgi:hypothetical protein
MTQDIEVDDDGSDYNSNFVPEETRPSSTWRVAFFTLLCLVVAGLLVVLIHASLDSSELGRGSVPHDFRRPTSDYILSSTNWDSTAPPQFRSYH